MTWYVGTIPPPWREGRAFIPRPLIQFSRIKYLSFSPGCVPSRIDVFYVLFLLHYFPAIKRISLLSNAIRENPHDYHWRVRLLNYYLNVKGVLKTVNTGDGGEKWIWRAPGGQTLRWLMYPFISADSDQ